MRTALHLVAGAVLLAGGDLLAAEVGPFGPAPRPPFELTRSLQALQDQIALGSRAASSAQRGLLVHIGEQFLAADPGVWREPANARAAIVYTLSGGRPNLLHKLVEGGLLPEAEAELARGALAYATGRRDEAWTHLKKVNARTLPPSLGAHLALVQASLTMDDDPGAAIEYLETARLLAPGTLIEEAALRRQLSAASALSDADGFLSLARQYIRRFPNSVYAANFLRSFPEMWAKMALPGDAETFARLDATVAGLDAGDRRDLYLELAVGELVAGDAGTARFAAAGAGGLAEAGSVEAARAGLYAAAAEVAGTDSLRALEALRVIDPSSLPARDAALHAAALAVAEQVLSQPDAARPAEGGAEAPEDSEILARGREAIAAADALMEKTR